VLAWLNARRTMGVRDALNPAFWYRRWQGFDLYDPVQRILYHGNRRLREVALTIDDGPYAETGPQLLDLLQHHSVRATFFVVGDRIKMQPEQIVRMLAEGHEVANHSMTHQHRLDTLPAKNVRNELQYCDVNFQRVTGRSFSLMRPPGVRYNDTVLAVARELGYTTVSYTTGARDYDNVPADFIVDRIVRRTENGSILLLHDGNPATVEALPRILTALKREGYRFVTVSEMIGRLPVSAR